MNQIADGLMFGIKGECEAQGKTPEPEATASTTKLTIIP